VRVSSCSELGRHLIVTPPVSKLWNGSPDYPQADKIPNISDPHVLEWIEEVKASGIVIPNLSPVDGSLGCEAAANTAAAADPSRCWWTCTGMSVLSSFCV
jgi:hypothetical protein